MPAGSTPAPPDNFDLSEYSAGRRFELITVAAGSIIVGNVVNLAAGDLEAAVDPHTVRFLVAYHPVLWSYDDQIDPSSVPSAALTKPEP